MAFVRRKGNAFYLVHNVRRGGKVQQLHLARLGERARITDDIVREVTKKHPFVELNWRLADLFPPVLRLSESPAVARELLVQLRLLHSSIQVKLDQFARKDDLKRLGRTGGRFGNAHPGFRER